METEAIKDIFILDFFFCSVKDGFLCLLSLMIHLRVSDMWLLCRAPCYLKESNFLDKYCHYAVIYPFAIRAYSLISSFMICLPKGLHCVVHVLDNQIKYPCSHSASLFHTQLASLYQSLPHILPELLDKSLTKKPTGLCVLCISFLSLKSTRHGVWISPVPPYPSHCLMAWEIR